MRNFMTASLLCSLSCISVSGSESQTVEVQPGEDVTLLCSNFSSSHAQIIWFRLIRAQLLCVSSMFLPHERASFCDGFKNGKFEMSSNISNIFLKIREVDLSDSGLYFCGFHVGRKPVIVDATYLDVRGFDGITKQMSVILAGLTVCLILVVICLAVKIKKLQKARVEEQNPQRNKNQASDDLNYAAVTFRPKETRRNHRPASDREVESCTIYSATR